MKSDVQPELRGLPSNIQNLFTLPFFKKKQLLIPICVASNEKFQHPLDSTQTTVIGLVFIIKFHWPLNK